MTFFGLPGAYDDCQRVGREVHRVARQQAGLRRLVHVLGVGGGEDVGGGALGQLGHQIRGAREGELDVVPGLSVLNCSPISVNDFFSEPPRTRPAARLPASPVEGAKATHPANRNRRPRGVRGHRCNALRGQHVLQGFPRSQWWL